VDPNLETLISDVLTRAGYLIRSRFSDVDYRRIVRRNRGDVSRRIDLEVEEFIIGEIAREGINCMVITEERGMVRIGDRLDHIVVLDPLDGSLNFVLGIPFYSISIAMGRYKEAGTLNDLTVGAVYNVNTDVLYYADAGGLRIRGIDVDTDPTVMDKPVASIYVEPTVNSKALEGLRSIYERIGGFRVRSLGSASLEMIMASLGRFTMFLDLRGRLRIYDIAGAYVVAKSQGAIALGNGGVSMGDLPLDPSLRTSALVTRYSEVARLAVQLL